MERRTRPRPGRGGTGGQGWDELAPADWEGRAAAAQIHGVGEDGSGGGGERRREEWVVVDRGIGLVRLCPVGSSL